MTGPERPDIARWLDAVAAPVTRLGLWGAGDLARDLARAAHRRWGCRVDLIALGPDAAPSDAAARAAADDRAALIAAGLNEDQIRIAPRLVDLRPMEAVLAPDAARAGDPRVLLRALIRRGLTDRGIVLADLPRGGGMLPWLAQFGQARAHDVQDGPGGARVLLRFNLVPQTPVDRLRQSWRQGTNSLTGPDGFVTEGDCGHAMLHRPGNRDTLIVSFDNLDFVAQDHSEAKPWGYDFVTRNGWSLLATMAPGWTWFRSDFVSQSFDRLRDEGFFRQFDRVVFYGVSMGGYGAAAFSAACPGADVVVMNPQSTLDRRLVPFERRYRRAWHLDFSGPYGDAAQASATARRVTLIHDPHEPLDRAHAARFTAPNVQHLHAPWLGHRMASAMAGMGVLSQVVRSAIAGDLDQPQLSRILRARHALPRFQLELMDKAEARHRPDLAARIARYALAQGGGAPFRSRLARLGAQPAAEKDQSQ
ncbi:hypothetical protein ACEYYB_04545 [Paracoccus sp. p4-l81]|uniref:hypothetical protein n=1 Tax=Paracoccus sp. p4-l81 TaxID=3342806 RepID=UPI0035B8DF66